MCCPATNRLPLKYLSSHSYTGLGVFQLSDELSLSNYLSYYKQVIQSVGKGPSKYKCSSTSHCFSKIWYNSPNHHLSLHSQPVHSKRTGVDALGFVHHPDLNLQIQLRRRDDCNNLLSSQNHLPNLRSILYVFRFSGRHLRRG